MAAFTNTAEDLAARFARACGYAVLSRNDRRFGAEIDMLCRTPAGDLIVFEVKRQHVRADFPAVSYQQRTRLSRAIAHLTGDAGKHLTVSLHALMVDLARESVCVIPLADYSDRHADHLLSSGI